MQKEIRNIFQKLNGRFYWKEEMLKDAEVLNLKNQWLIKGLGSEVHFSTRCFFYAIIIEILKRPRNQKKKSAFLEKFKVRESLCFNKIQLFILVFYK